MITRPPHPALRPFVSQVWASEESDILGSTSSREHALPTGAMHLVFRLSEQPLRVFRSSSDAIGYTVGNALVGGVRSAHYIRDISTPARSVGAMLRPGAAQILFGASAEEFAERHTRLDCVWGSQAHALHAQLAEAATPTLQLRILEQALLSRAPTVRGLHPAVPAALEQFDGLTPVQIVVERTGYSHRRFIEQFRCAVGLTPKTYLRIQRFQRALELTQHESLPNWSHIAADLGFTDQSHLIRDFKAFAGITPEQYRLAKPSARNHVPR